MKILFTGGGSGGHVFPIIAIVREIRKFSLKKEVEFYYVGPKDDFAKMLLSQEGIKTKEVLAGKIRRSFNFVNLLKNIVDIVFNTPLGMLQSFFYLFFLAPDLVFSKGGFGSFPSCLMAKILGAPVFLHESDAVPGLVNKMLAGISKEVFISFRQTPFFSKKRMILVGNPIRRELLTQSREKAREFFAISSEKPVVLVLGGSQGAQRINDKILEILPLFLQDFELIHQCGEKNFEQVKNEAKAMIAKNIDKYYHLSGFLKEDELKKAYASCDYIVSRAGSNALFEIAAVGKPSILIPLPESAQDHQLKNAYTYADQGACYVIEENNFTPRFFLSKLKLFASQTEETEKMIKAAREFAKPLAARVIAAYLITYLNLM